MVDQKDFLQVSFPDTLKRSLNRFPQTPGKVENVEVAYTPIDQLEQRFAQATYNLFIESPDEPEKSDFHSRDWGLPEDYRRIVKPLIRPFVQTGIDLMSGQLRLSVNNPESLKKIGIEPGEVIRTKEKFDLALLAVLPENERPVSYRSNERLAKEALWEIFGAIAKISKQKTDQFTKKATIKIVGAGAVKTDDRLLPWLSRVFLMIRHGRHNFDRKMNQALNLSLYNAEAQNIYRVVRYTWPKEN